MPQPVYWMRQWEGILFIPGTAFFLDGRGRNALRLSYSQAGEDTLREAARRLGALLYRANRVIDL